MNWSSTHTPDWRLPFPERPLPPNGRCASAPDVELLTDSIPALTPERKRNADFGSFNWVTTPGVKGKLKTVLKSTTAGSTYLWETDNTINGYPAYATNQVPSGLTFGTSTTLAGAASPRPASAADWRPATSTGMVTSIC